jgi:N-acetyl-anhydromuramyl-L-alanine amidase AmpD
MPSRFIGGAAENFREGRPAGFAPEAIVLHRTGGTRDSFRARFNDPAMALSAHYVVCRDGSVDQYVLEEDTAFHAGRAVGATWRGLRASVNPNFYTIGIELEGAQTDSWPDSQIDATATLIADVARRWDMAIDADHVILHSAIRPSSGCPAATCPLGQIIETARARTMAAPVPRQTVVRTLTRTNLREGAPTSRAPIVRVIPADTEIVVSGFTDSGERVQGNPSWYSDGDDHFLWAGATNVPSPSADDGVAPVLTMETGSTDIMELSRHPEPPSPAAASVGVAVDRTTLVLPVKEFMAEETRKDLIVLHFTAGRTARSAFDTWRNDPRRRATSYIVDVDGTIYEVFSPRFWAAHLGIEGTKNLHDRRSIGIEIANVGPLQPSTEDPRILNWWLPRTRGAREFTTRFCGLEETEKYLRADFRTKKHFAAFADIQVDAVGALVRGLCEHFSIPATLPPQSRRFECNVHAFASYKGVCTHANFRQDKWDIGPAFAWERLGL